jgi:hypothetical protein
MKAFTSPRVVLTHMSADMLRQPEKVDLGTAHDGLILQI